MRLRFLVLAVVLTAFPSAAWSQCGTTAPANKFCGNDTGASALSTWKSIPPGALSAIAAGTVLGNRTGVSAVPTPVTNPVLGIPGASTGEVGLAGSTSGTAVLRAQAAAGSAVSLLPTTAGTLVGSAAAPMAINGTTGAVSITGLAGGLLAGAGPAFSTSPVLGVPGASQGSLGFAGATSGTVTVQAQATAGTVALTLPNASGTVAANATTPLVLSATTGTLTCPTCVTSSGGGAISGTAPISVSAAGVVSINAPYVSLTASNGGVVYSGATNLAILAGTATASQILVSGSSAAPSWSTATYPTTAAAGTMLNAATSNAVTATATPTLGANGGTGGQLTLSGSTSGTGIIRVAAAAGSGIVFQLPSSNGSNTNVLSTNGSGVTSWVAAGSGTMTNVATSGLATGGPITTTGTVTVTAATQADQETATSTTTAITPAVQQYHPSAVKFAIHCTQSAGTYTVVYSYNSSTNAATCGKTGTGRLTLVPTVAFSATAAYSCVLGTSSFSQNFIFNNSASAITVGLKTTAGADTDMDFTAICAGDQ